MSQPYTRHEKKKRKHTHVLRGLSTVFEVIHRNAYIMQNDTNRNFETPQQSMQQRVLVHNDK